MPTYIYKRVLPVDLLEVANDQGEETTLADAIAAIQTDRNFTYDCPNCVVGEQSTGYVDILDPPIKIVCPICGGYLKTQLQYIPNPTYIYEFIPFTLIIGPNTVLVGETIQLSDAVPTGAWSSSDEAIATVNATTGLVTGVAEGDATIRYTIGDYYVELPITVTVPEIEE